MERDWMTGPGPRLFDVDRSCCFTGHRPEKLPWRDREGDPRCLQLKQRLAQALMEAYGEGVRHFICGMARGTDLYFGEAVLELREAHPEVTLEAALPCQEQTQRWPEADRLRHRRLLERCNLETLVQPHYDQRCMLRRNYYMVDHAGLVLTVYNGLPRGGTAQTLLYARRRGRRIREIFWEDLR